MKPDMTTREAIQHISTAMNAAVIGQSAVVERLLIAFLADGHVLMEGLPGVAKTRSIKTLGRLVETDPPDGPLSDGREAEEIGHVVEIVGRCMPFRALCLQQAIAVRRMLDRRGIPAMVYLGIARDRADRAQAELGRAAHAWVTVGSRVISGEGVLEKYAIVARFA